VSALAQQHVMGATELDLELAKAIDALQ